MKVHIRWLYLLLRIGGFTLLLYAMAYSLLMYRNQPVFDSNTWEVVSRDRYWFSPVERAPGYFTVYVTTSCWANRVFWPMEQLRTSIWPGKPLDDNSDKCAAERVYGEVFFRD